ncbi:extracellular calcium-sensing receptor-like [Pelobates cultripes]|uniref:Extracellular calcium-sensing receptor-like n=1 Tax=Pelobates cultripes TaxID=61616 RepID=A0AAD1RJJ4_PELCU|nr:extracellular calcium-sensing receptor-like [Pelobates cultripes]
MSQPDCFLVLQTSIQGNGQFLSKMKLSLTSKYREKGNSCTEVQRPRQKGYTQKGDVMIGGLFPIHTYRKDTKYSFRERKLPVICASYSTVSYSWMQAMRFAIDEINTDKTLLPNISLGFQIFDTCVHISQTFWGTLWTLSGEDSPILNYQCQPSVPLAIVGDAISTTSFALATLLGVYRYPQVSYLASASSSNNHFLYPSLLRTIPSDGKQSRALARLVSYMGWNWVGLLSLDDDFGMSGSQILKMELNSLGVCLAYHEVFGTETSMIKMQFIKNIVIHSSAMVVIIFSRDPLINRLADLLVAKEDTGKIWVACTGWSNSPIVSITMYSHIMMGTLGFSYSQVEMKGFREYLLAIQPSTLIPDDIFLPNLWEIVHDCSWTGGKNKTLLCTGHEKLETFKNKEFEYDEFDFRIHYLVYDAVYVIAHAINQLNLCFSSGEGSGWCVLWCVLCKKHINLTPGHIGYRVLYYMRNIHFLNKMGGEMYFDVNGDPPTEYDVVNWQRNSDGSIEFVAVGHFRDQKSQGTEFSINTSAIQWITGKHEIPRSVCSESCSPGFRKATQEGQPPCCFDCIPCSEGEISNEIDLNNCFACSPETWPNENNTNCIPKVVEFLSFWEPLGIILTLATMAFSFITISILYTFLRNKDTAIVKANNRGIAYLLLASLSLNFLCPLLFIGEPQRYTCIFRQGAFGVIFVLSVSSVLAKTIMVVIAFTATKPNSNMRKWLGPQVPALIISTCTLIQLLISLYWILSCPSFPERNIRIKTGIIVFQCNECSDTLLWCMLGYMAFLACVSFLVAFLARKLPDNFNEAKWITFSMLIFLSVWISFVPAYLSTYGKYMVSVEIFAIISSSAGVLVCIFLPKSYIIIFRPDLNTRGQLLGKGSSQKTSTSS